MRSVRDQTKLSIVTSCGLVRYEPTNVQYFLCRAGKRREFSDVASARLRLHTGGRRFPVGVRFADLPHRRSHTLRRGGLSRLGRVPPPPHCPLGPIGGTAEDSARETPSKRRTACPLLSPNHHDRGAGAPPRQGDISKLEKRGHLYFALTNRARDVASRSRKVSVEDGRSASGRRCRRSNPETRSQRCWMDRKGTIAKIEPLPMLVGVSTLAVRFSGHNGRQRIR